MARNDSTKGHLAALLTILVWGTTFISTKVLLRAFSPVEILFTRFLIGYVALWLLRPKFFRLQNRREELLFMGAGLCGVSLYFLFENIALTYSMASNIGVIISISPFFTAILAHFFLDGEKLRGRFFVGFAAAMGGIVLISLNGLSLNENPLGVLLAILATVVWACYSILTRKISALGYHVLQTTRRTFFWGLLFLLPILPIMGFSPDWSLLQNPVNLWNLVYLGLGASALCFVTWNVAVKLLGAVKTSVYIYMVPVITVAASALILGEPVTPLVVLGTALTLLGLFLSESKAKAKAPAEQKETG